MKNKLFCTMIFLFFASFGVTAKAEVQIDVSTCSKVFLAYMPNWGEAHGLFCPSEGPNYIAVFFRMDMWTPCYFNPASMNYRTTGNCENYAVYRLN